MDDPKVHMFYRCIEKKIMNPFSVEEVTWWFEEQARCKTYDLHFLSRNNDEEIEK